MSDTESRTSRTELILGEDGVMSLGRRRVAVFGLGGVGGYAVEALTRSGIGTLDIIDGDVVSISNLNRQIIACEDSVGVAKVSLWEERIHAINRDTVVNGIKLFYLPGLESRFSWEDYDYVVDAIDTVAGKLGIIEQCHRAGIPVISSMGTGNKLGTVLPEIDYIENTSVCPLARVMRKELKQRGIEHIKVLYSKEKPVINHRPPGSVAWVPGIAGLMIAGEVVRDLVS